MADIERLESDIHDIKLFLLTLDDVLRKSDAYKDANFVDINFLTEKVNKWDRDIYGED